MSVAPNKTEDQLAFAQQFQADQVAYLMKGDIDGLVQQLSVIQAPVRAGA